MDNKNFISKYDLFATLIVTIMGTGIFSYPRQLCEVLGTDGWIAIVLSGVIFYLAILILHKSIKINNYELFEKVIDNNFGKTLGKIIALAVAILGIIIVSLEMRTFTEVIKMYLLERTPTEFIIAAMVLTGTYLVRGELETLIRFNEIAFFLMFIPAILVLIFVLKGADFTNIFPMFTHKPKDYLLGIKESLFSFLGFGVLYMVFPFVKDKKEIKKVSCNSMIFITGFYIIVYVISLAIFTKEHNAQLLWPTITMINLVDIPGAFVERWEGIVMLIWVMFYITTYVNIYYFIAEIVRDVFNLEDVKISLSFLIPIVYVLSLYPSNIIELYNMQNLIIPYIDLFVVLIIPLLLLIIGTLKAGRRKNEV